MSASITIVPEVVGAPSIQGGIIIQANNRPENASDKDSWYVPAHCPVFFDKTQPMESVLDVTAKVFDLHRSKIAGVSIDGLYDAEHQRTHQGIEGVNRFAMAIGGLVTVAARPENARQFKYGDPVYVLPYECKVERLIDTNFVCRLSYTNDESTISKTGSTSPSDFLLGTFVERLDESSGGMRVMLNLGV